MKVLIVEDTLEKYIKIKRELEKCRIQNICQETTLDDAKKKIVDTCEKNEVFDLIITDMQYPTSRGACIHKEAGVQLIDYVNTLNLHIPMIICSSGRYPTDKENVLGALYYSDTTDWETELRKLIDTIPSPRKQ